MPETHDSRLQYVFDSTVFSNFAAVGRIPLLEKLYRDYACTTMMVAVELQQGIEAGYDYLSSAVDCLKPPAPQGWLPVVSLQSDREQTLYSELCRTLGLGEASCLVVAEKRGLILATDDLAARRAAELVKVELTGTLGILIRLVREETVGLNEANQILAQMVNLKYRSPIDRLDDLI